MTTQKQITANQQNASLSTGATTEQGKSMVAQNAIKHGIFTKSLIISNGDGKENENDYNQLLGNLIESLNPQNQMESLLVEKIAVDFWRLRRVISFETGSIRRHLDMVIDNYYDPKSMIATRPRSNKEINSDIAAKKYDIDWNNNYTKLLKKGIVKFDKPEWNGEGVTSNIENDLYSILENLIEEIADEQQQTRFYRNQMDFEDMHQLLTNAGFKTDKDIADALMPCLEKENDKLSEEIKGFEREKQRNAFAEDRMLKIHALPEPEAADKLLRYEKTIQNSIAQNLIMLKKLQSLL